MSIKQFTHTNEILLNPKFRIVFAVSVVNDSGEGMRCTEEKWINNTSNIEIILNSSILEFRFAPYSAVYPDRNGMIAMQLTENRFVRFKCIFCFQINRICQFNLESVVFLATIGRCLSESFIIDQ